jgi:gliding motility-associated-like protein
VKQFLLSCFILISGNCFPQGFVYPQTGQLPTNPFPICGIGEFRQLVVPYGSGGFIPIAGCGKVEARNPFYYSINCYAAGKLGLFIEPLDSFQDYNWELFDITGRNPNDIFTDSSMQIIGNWAGGHQPTGTNSSGITATACLSNPAANFTTFSYMPTLIQGHQYLLLVCSYSDVQADYLISFPGSTAVMQDLQVPHMQSATLGCNKKTIDVVMNKNMRCNSLAQDGSEFSINAAGVRITSATTTTCSDQFDYNTFQLTMSDTLAPGNYFLTANTGSSGLSMFDDCLKWIGEGEQIPFTVVASAAVSAEFNYQIGYGCANDTIFFDYPLSQNGVVSSWLIDSSFVSSLPEPVIEESLFGTHQVQHIARNGSCSDSVTKTINLDNGLRAGFQAPAAICPKDLANFSDTSIGNIVSWNWSFGDGSSTDLKNPSAHLFPDVAGEKKYLVTLIVKNNLGCYDTISKPIIKYQSCIITVPNAFTPNGDGKNDFLYPLNSFSARELQFMVYNRFGQLVFVSHDPSGKWDGKINGAAQPTGSFLWTLRYTDGNSGKQFFLHGTTLLIR